MKVCKDISEYDLKLKSIYKDDISRYGIFLSRQLDVNELVNIFNEKIRNVNKLIDLVFLLEERIAEFESKLKDLDYSIGIIDKRSEDNLFEIKEFSNKLMDIDSRLKTIEVDKEHGYKEE